MLDPVLRAAQWATVGGIMPGIIHDLSNSLNTLIGFADLWRTDTSLPSDLRNDLNEIVKAGLHARDLLAWLRELTQVPLTQPTMEQVNLPEVCDRALALLTTPLRRRNIRVTCDYHPQTPLVWGCSRCLLLLAICLLRNACDALDNGGNITVRVYGDDSAVMLEVEDNNGGIPASVQERLFEPFVTTKPHGAGLGLMLAHTIAVKSGGELSLVSRSGKGTKAIVRLPKA